MHLARGLSRRTEKGKAYGPIKRAKLYVKDLYKIYYLMLNSDLPRKTLAYKKILKIGSNVLKHLNSFLGKDVQRRHMSIGNERL